jgi:hypothetical protein
VTPADLRAALTRLGLTQTGAARRWGLPLRTLQHWCSGTRAIPPLLPHLLALEEGEADPLWMHQEDWTLTIGTDGATKPLKGTNP